MDSTEEYVPDHMVPYGHNWQQHLPPHYPHPVPTVAHIPFPTSHNPYSSQQIASASSYAAPIPQPYPSIAGFAGQSPSLPVPTEFLDHLKQALQKIQELPQMADPLSLMASLIAVAAAGVQVSRTLYNFAGVVGGASEEIVSISKEISAVSGILRDLHDFFDDDAKDLISTRALFNANRILEDCKEVFAQIQRMLDCCNAAGRVNFWQSLQWSFRRDNVKPMCAKLESFKLTLTILLSTMRLARCKQDIGDRSGLAKLSNVLAD
jgi:Fungal N-terminal domain of STAND proteins